MSIMGGDILTDEHEILKKVNSYSCLSVNMDSLWATQERIYV